MNVPIEEDCDAVICVLPKDVWNATPKEWCAKHRRLHAQFVAGRMGEMSDVDWYSDPDETTMSASAKETK